MKILQIGMTPNPGGIENFILNYYKMLNESLVFDFINPYDQELAYTQEIKQLGGAIFYVNNFKKKPYEYYNDLKKIIKENQYDIIHINVLSYANFVPFFVIKKLGIKNVVIHSHNSNIPGIIRKILHILNKMFFKNIGYKVACSQCAGEFMFGKKTRFEIISNAIDYKKYAYNHQNKLKIKKQYKIKDEIVLGCIGRLSEQKNQRFLLNVITGIGEQMNLKLFLVGEDKTTYGKLLQQDVIKKSLEDKIFFTGKKNNVNEYLSFFDCLLAPSKFEGLSIALVEAQASDVVIFASDKISNETKLTDKMIFLPLETKAWIDGLLNLDNYKRDSSVFINSSYDITKSSTTLLLLYESILARNRKSVNEN